MRRKRGQGCKAGSDTGMRTMRPFSNTRKFALATGESPQPLFGVGKCGENAARAAKLAQIRGCDNETILSYKNIPASYNGGRFSATRV